MIPATHCRKRSLYLGRKQSAHIYGFSFSCKSSFDGYHLNLKKHQNDLAILHSALPIEENSIILKRSYQA
jgi:hypothetical protein